MELHGNGLVCLIKPKEITVENRKEFTQQRNEGEGNRTAARDYNQAQQRFVKSGQVEERARQAERDIRNEDIRRELAHAEVVGRRHAAGEAPEVTRRAQKN
jgi:hypothetical protein